MGRLMHIWTILAAAAFNFAVLPGLAGAGSAPVPASGTLSFRQKIVAPDTSSAKGSLVCEIGITIERDEAGKVTGGSAEFVADLNFDSGITVRGLHLRSGNAALGAGIEAAKPFTSRDGKGRISRTVRISPDDRSAMAIVHDIESDPKSLGLSLQVDENPAEAFRTPLLPELNLVPFLAKEENQKTAIYLINPSSNSEAHALLKIHDGYGNPLFASPTAETAYLRIPPSGTASFSRGGSSVLPPAFAQVYSDAPVSVEVAYQFQGQKESERIKCTLAHMVSLPVSIDPERNSNTMIAIQATEETGTHLAFALADAAGADVPRGTDSKDLLFGKNLTILATELIPAIAGKAFMGTLTLERQWASFSAGRLVVIAIQIDKDGMRPVPVKIVRP